MSSRTAITASVSGLSGAIAVYLLFVRTATGQRLDGRLVPARGLYASDRLLAAYDRHVMPTELVVLLLVIAIAVQQHNLRRGLLSASMPLAVVAVVNVAKDTIARPGFGSGGSTHNSFPSGHVALAAATVIALCLVLPVAARAAVGIVGSFAVALIAVATIAAGWHRFSDGLGAVLISIAAGGLVVLLSPGHDGVPRPHAREEHAEHADPATTGPGRD